MSCRRGISLPDVLVGVSVMAILSVVLFPVVSRVHQQQSDRAGCLENVKKLNLAIKTYTLDHDNVFPFGLVYAGREVDNWWKRNAEGSAGLYGSYYMWPDILMPYVKTEDTFSCPYRADDWIGYGWSSSLGYIAGRPHSDRKGPLYDGRSVDQIAYPSLTPMVADHRNTDGDSTSIYNFLLFYIVRDTMDEWTGLHEGMANIGFVDGHAEAYRPEEAWDICTMKEQGSLYWFLGRREGSRCGLNW